MQDYNSAISKNLYSNNINNYQTKLANKASKYRSEAIQNIQNINTVEFDNYNKYRANPVREKYKNLNKQYYEGRINYTQNTKLPTNTTQYSEYRNNNYNTGRNSSATSTKNVFGKKLSKFQDNRLTTLRDNSLIRNSSQYNLSFSNKIDQNLNGEQRLSSNDFNNNLNFKNLNYINNNDNNNSPLSIKSNKHRHRINLNNNVYNNPLNKISTFNENEENDLTILIKENMDLKVEIDKLKKERILIERKAKEIMRVNNELNDDNESMRQEIDKLNEIISENSVSESVHNERINNKNLLLKYNNIEKKCNYLYKQNKEYSNDIQRYKNELDNYKKNNKVLLERINTDTNNLIEKENTIQKLTDQINSSSEINNIKNIKENNGNNNNLLINENKKINEELNEIKKKYNSIDRINQELTVKNNALTEENSKLKEDIKKNIKESLNISYIQNQITELEKENELLQREKNNIEKEKNDKITELTLLIATKEKEIESYKEDKGYDNNIYESNKEEYDNLKKKYNSTLKDCENYKLINNKLMSDISDKEKEISKYKNIIDENNKNNDELSNLKNLLVEKESEIKNLTEINEKLEANKPKLRINENNDGRISIGSAGFDGLTDLEKIDKYKSIIKDQKDELNIFMEQNNMLKEDIKNLKKDLQLIQSLQGEIKNINEFKKLFKKATHGYKPSKKEEKEAFKKLEEFLKN